MVLTVALVSSGFSTRMAARQRSDVLRASMRVRLDLPQGRPQTLIGQLVFANTQSISVRSMLGVTTVPWGAVGSLERSRGIHPALRIVPPLLGAGLGAVIGHTLFSGSDRCRLARTFASECNPILPNEVVGAAWGALILGVAGIFVARERWELIPIEPIMQVPTRRAVGGFPLRWQ